MRTGLTVIAYITAKVNCQEELRGALLDLVAQTRKENGCINYDLHQSQENKSKFVIYENWNKVADLDAHAKSAHLQAFTKNTAHLLESRAEITKWSTVSELSR